jgi:3-hydroxyacyl-CoA dehydrogenase
MTQKVRVERDGRVAVILIDNPPINAGSAEVRRGLLEAVQQVASDQTLDAAVLLGAGSTFIAGSDLREFGRPLQPPELPEVIAAIEKCPKPVVAALHGSALGGGFELALGCDARVAAEGAVVGLPEVTLGIIPGAGGTQRLPRLVGCARAIQMICAGERVPTAMALELGLVDETTPGDLRAAAVAHAAGLRGRKRPLRLQPVPAVATAQIDDAAEQAAKAGKRRPAVLAAIAAVRSATTLPIDAALAHERAAFQALRTTREAKALRHLFFAERESGRHSGLGQAEPNPVQQVAVIGAGTMGSGIAIAALDAGLDVILVEQAADALRRGVERVREHYAGRVAAGKLEASEAAARAARLQATLDWSALAQADLVIEAVFEDLAVKQDVFRRIDAAARTGAVLASNTSYLDLDAIAAATRRAGDVIGLHFFSPAQAMRLLEVVRGAATSAGALATGLALGKRMKKLPVLSANAFGFIGNRVFSAYRRQCEFLLEEGALPEQVDAALEQFGFAMGPFAVADLSGLDIAWRMRQSLAAGRDPTARYVRIPDLLCEAGRLGRKTGAGYYLYEGTGKPARRPDATVRSLVEAQSRAKRIERRLISDEEIQRRALLAMVNETALLLGEGVTQRATDVDVVLANGYGFPRWEGGPVFWARDRGHSTVAADIEWLAHVSGPGFVPGPVHMLFESSSTKETA